VKEKGSTYNHIEAVERFARTGSAYDPIKAIRSTHKKLIAIIVNIIYKSDYHFKKNCNQLAILQI
jgi:hypothetical protein